MQPTLPWWPHALKLWMEGYNYAEIARGIGRSRQLLYQFRELFPERPWAQKEELVDIVDPGTIRKWVRAGHVRVSPSGLVHREDVEDHAWKLANRPCPYPGCRNVLNTYRADARWCPDCSLKVRQNRYTIMSAEERQRHHGYVERWEAKNPEKAKDISRRAGVKYRARKRRQQLESQEVGSRDESP